MVRFLNFAVILFIMVTSAKDGRVYIPKDLRKKMGDRFHVVDKGDKIVLVPVSEEPLQTLRNEFKNTDKSVEELKNKAMETAIEEAGK